MRIRWIALTPVLLAGHLSAQARSDTSTKQLRAELTRRLDSLSRLDPRRELAAALRRGDWRFIGIHGYTILAPGVALDEPLYPAADSIRVIAGTSDGVWAPEVERLDDAAARYAQQYNRLLLETLRRVRRGPTSRPAT